MFRPSTYKYLNNSELGYYFAGRETCQPLLLVGEVCKVMTAFYIYWIDWIGMRGLYD